MQPTKQQIDNVLNQCSDLEDSGANPFYGMTYAQGVKAGIEWMLGEADEPPFSE